MLLGTIDVILLRNLLKCKEVKFEIPGWGLIKADEGTIRGDQEF